MSSRNIEFIVGKVDRSKSQMRVGGRCGDLPIKVGDVFNIVYHYPPRKTLEDYGRHLDRIDERPTLLRVEKIRSYEHLWNELYPGMTGELELYGKDEQLQKGDILGKSEVE